MNLTPLSKRWRTGIAILIPVPTEHFFHRNIAMFSDKGVNLVVDKILHNEDTTKDCYEILNDYPVLFVGVHCPLTELEKREKDRGDRTIGQAKAQLNYVNQQGEVYDIEVDTSKGIDSAANAGSNSQIGWESTFEQYFAKSP